MHTAYAHEYLPRLHSVYELQPTLKGRFVLEVFCLLVTSLPQFVVNKHKRLLFTVTSNLVLSSVGSNKS